MIKTNNTWVAYGDVNPLDHGGVWSMMDDSDNNCFTVITVDLYPDQLSNDKSEYRYQVTNTYIDITDSWIDWSEIQSYTGIEEKFAHDVIAYCGAYNSGGRTDLLTGDKAVIEWLCDRGIDVK